MAKTCDLLIYGATPAGITAAIQASKRGLKVHLLEPTAHLGGMVTGGLGWTDYGEEQTIGGLSRVFFEKVGRHYDQEIGWHFEPKVASQVYREMLGEAGPGLIAVHFNTALDRELKDGVVVSHGKIESMTTKDGQVWQAKVWMDCTYEGDLMAKAGVSYRIGREARDEYGEFFGGVLDPRDDRIRQPKACFPKEVSPYIIPNRPDSGLCWGIHGTSLPNEGAGDDKTQAFIYRMCMTDDPNNALAVKAPEGYDPSHYELLGRLAEHQPNFPLRSGGKGNRGYLKISPMPNHKTDMNDGCVFSLDYLGANWDYPEANDARRFEIIQDHTLYTQGLLYFIQTDPRIQPSVREEFSKFGYPADEYIENQHFSPQLYVREARRLLGEKVMSENDCLRETIKNDSIAIGSYGVDSHHIQRVVLDGRIYNEGNFMGEKAPYEIPYPSITPKQSECQNLLVPVCISSTHVAFGSIRMEPVWMVLGQSAAEAASLAIEKSCAVQEIDMEQLQSRLKQGQQRIRLSECL